MRPRMSSGSLQRVNVLAQTDCGKATLLFGVTFDPERWYES